MNQELEGQTVFDFPGVTVIVPSQTERPGKAISKDLPHIKSFPNRSNFTPKRIIANLVILDAAADEKNYTTAEVIRTFGPPIKIHVGYRIDDLFECARLGTELKLAYWDEITKEWVVISTPSNQYRILPPDTAPIAETYIYSWAGDPPLAWGK